MRVMSLTSKNENTKEVSKVFEDGFKNFDAGKAETFDPNDRERLIAVIEASFGTLEPFNEIVRDVSKSHDKRTLTKRASGKLSTPEPAKLPKKMDPQQKRNPAETADDDADDHEA